MKKRWIVIIMDAVLIVCVMLWFYYLQNNRDMDIYNSHIMGFGDYHEEHISVIVNKLYVEDIESCAEEIVERCRKNEFKSIFFSYDVSIPNELQVTAYLSERDLKRHKELFSFRYEQDEPSSAYNIADHPEKFKLKIKQTN